MSDILECVVAELKAYISSESERVISEKLELLLNTPQSINIKGVSVESLFDMISQLRNEKKSLYMELEDKSKDIANLNNEVIKLREKLSLCATIDTELVATKANVIPKDIVEKFCLTKNNMQYGLGDIGDIYQFQDGWGCGMYKYSATVPDEVVFVKWLKSKSVSFSFLRTCNIVQLMEVLNDDSISIQRGAYREVAPEPTSVISNFK